MRASGQFHANVKFKIKNLVFTNSFQRTDKSDVDIWRFKYPCEDFL